MRSLVTGGAGFIGSNLVDALVANGDSVLVVDDLSSGRRENLRSALESGSADLAVGSIADEEFIGRQVSTFKPDRIFHLAAQIDVRRAVDEPRYDAEINVLGTINLLEAARQHDVSSFIFASTGGAIYGEGEGRSLPLAEDSATRPEAGYGVSKLAGEAYVSLYGRLHGVAGLALRFANVYGPRQDPHGEAGVVAIFAGQLQRGEALGVVGDGLQTRDYVFVGDVVAALVAAGDRVAGVDRSSLAEQGPLNIGTGIETSVLELADALGEAVGRRPEVRHLPVRPGEVKRIAIDASAAARLLDWSAQTELSDGLKITYEAIAAEAQESPA